MRLQDNTPEIYYNHSRDFQFIGRLYDIVLNSVKTDIDTIKYLRLGLNSNEQLLNLLAMTLGFKAKHNYNNKQLEAICSVLPSILKNKGNNTALYLAINAILNAEGVNDYSELSFNYDTMTLTAYVPETIGDLTLLEDLTDYIIPAGVGLKLVKEIKEIRKVNTSLQVANSANVYVDNVIDTDANKITELSRIIKAGNYKTSNDESILGNQPAIQNSSVRIQGTPATETTTPDTDGGSENE